MWGPAGPTRGISEKTVLMVSTRREVSRYSIIGIESSRVRREMKWRNLSQLDVHGRRDEEKMVKGGMFAMQAEPEG